MRRILFLAISIITLSMPVIAANNFATTDNEVNKLNECVKKMIDYSGAWNVCQDDITDDCTGSGTIPLKKVVNCQKKELKAWDVLLNTKYQRLMKIAKTQNIPKIKDTERQWVKFKDKKCAFPHYGEENYDLISNQEHSIKCQINETAQQTIWLEQHLNYAELELNENNNDDSNNE